MNMAEALRLSLRATTGAAATAQPPFKTFKNDFDSLVLGSRSMSDLAERGNLSSLPESFKKTFARLAEEGQQKDVGPELLGFLKGYTQIDNNIVRLFG